MRMPQAANPYTKPGQGLQARPRQHAVATIRLVPRLNNLSSRTINGRKDGSQSKGFLGTHPSIHIRHPRYKQSSPSGPQTRFLSTSSDLSLRCVIVSPIRGRQERIGSPSPESSRAEKSFDVGIVAR